jgi:hypothetical protein
MAVRRKRTNRLLPGIADRTVTREIGSAHFEVPRQVRRTVIDFGSLKLPSDVTSALAEAFWNHVGVRSDTCIIIQWARLKVFSRFIAESRAVKSLVDVHRELLARYVEWLSAQRRPNGQPWTKSSGSGAYTTLRTLLQWLERCRPGLLGQMEYPFNPFPWRNRDSKGHRKIPAQDLRAILKACEHDIAQLRALRDRAQAEQAAQPEQAAHGGDAGPIETLGGLLDIIDRRYGGIVPPAKILSTAGHHVVRGGLMKHGGAKRVEPYLYPRAESLLPYYLAILIHTAGNPEAIAELARECLQPIPLLDDRVAFIWRKRRAGVMQRRSFRSADRFEPPTLVRELLEWTQRLRPHAPIAQRERVFLFNGVRGVRALSLGTAKYLAGHFRARHGLSHFALASIRPSVLTAFYRASRDLRQVKAVANHAHLAMTVRYVETAEVEAQHRAQVAALQSAFLGHIERRQASNADTRPSRSIPTGDGVSPPGTAVSMFGFDCKDPFAGIAPGTRRGELCSNFLGCLTCPNAVIGSDSTTLARFLQARDHLRAAAAHLHPARWERLYAPQLRILEEDILTRFSAGEVADAKSLQGDLPPLPDLR